MNVIKPETDEEKIRRLELANHWLMEQHDELIKLLNASMKCSSEYHELVERASLQTDRVLNMLTKDRK